VMLPPAASSLPEAASRQFNCTKVSGLRGDDRTVVGLFNPVNSVEGRTGFG